MAAEVAAIENTPHAIAERMIVDKVPGRPTDNSRRMGIYWNKPGNEFSPVTVKLYGIVSGTELNGTGDWNGYVPHQFAYAGRW